MNEELKFYPKHPSGIKTHKIETTVLNYPLFGGEKLIENASVVIENGVITSVAETENVDNNYLLMPGLIDAHTHMNTMDQIKKMLKNGITATCDVSAPASLIENSKTFANRIRNGYKPTDYANAVNAVNLMHSCGVRILAGTDANMGSFAPAVSYGTSMHHEMELLVQAGMTPLEVLKAATSNVAEAFDIKNIGVIAPGQPATMILIEGRPDRQITDSVNIRQVWINGEQYSQFLKFLSSSFSISGSL